MPQTLCLHAIMCVINHFFCRSTENRREKENHRVNLFQSSFDPLEGTFNFFVICGSLNFSPRFSVANFSKLRHDRPRGFNFSYRNFLPWIIISTKQ
jgi:hypothetical protein